MYSSFYSAWANKLPEGYDIYFDRCRGNDRTSSKPGNHDTVCVLLCSSDKLRSTALELEEEKDLF